MSIQIVDYFKNSQHQLCRISCYVCIKKKKVCTSIEKNILKLKLRYDVEILEINQAGFLYYFSLVNFPSVLHMVLNFLAVKKYLLTPESNFSRHYTKQASLFFTNIYKQEIHLIIIYLN